MFLNLISIALHPCEGGKRLPLGHKLERVPGFLDSVEFQMQVQDPFLEEKDCVKIFISTIQLINYLVEKTT